MASGTIKLNNYGTHSDRYVEGRIKWSSTANTAKNQSTLTLNLQIRTVRDDGFQSDKIWSQDTIRTFLECDTSSTGTASKEVDTTQLCNLRYAWATIKTLTYTVNHKDDGSRTMYIGGLFECKDNYDWYGTTSGRVAIKLDKINRNASVSSAPNFTDEDNPTMTYKVPTPSSTTKLEACISFDGSIDDIPYRDIDINGTSYTFELTEEERDILRRGTLNGSTERTVYFYVRSTVNGNTTTARLGKTLTIINAEPELSAFLLDTNEKTSALTGDSLAYLIKGYSTVSYEMNMSGVKGASITEYSAANGETIQNTSSGSFANVNNGTFNFSATDNRGLTTTKEITLNVIDYFKPTCSQEVSIEMMEGEAGAVVKIVVEGEWSSRHFGAAHNELWIEYRYKTNDGEWSDWSGSTYITDDNSYRITFTKEGLDYTKPYIFQSRARDSLDSAETAEYPIRLIPVFDWGENDFNFNVPVKIKGDLTIEGNLKIGGSDSSGDSVIETGTAAMGTNGTWYWEKWSSGKATCYGVRNYGNMGVSTAWGSLYRSAIFTQDLPKDEDGNLIFNAAPQVINIDFSHGGMSAWVVKHEQTAPGADTTGSFMVVRAASATLSQVYLDFNLIGRWK